MLDLEDILLSGTPHLISALNNLPYTWDYPSYTSHNSELAEPGIEPGTCR